MSERARGHATATATPLVFPFTHIGGIGWLFSALLSGCPTSSSRRSTRDHDRRCCRREHGSRSPAPARRSTWPTSPRSASSRGERLFPSVRVYPGGGAPKPPQLHYDDQGRARRRRHRVGLRAHRGADPHHGAASHDTDEQARQHRGQGRCRASSSRVVTLDGTVAGSRRGGRDPRQGPAAHAAATSTRRSTPTAFDDDGWFRTGDLGVIDADGYVTITGRLKDIIIRKGENISRQGGRGPPLHPPEGRRRRGDRPARPEAGRAGVRRGRASPRTGRRR